jgi:quercetin 2,3-dioxygenase
MMTIRHAEDRGHENHGWLDSRHTFSFADYYDPKFMGFRTIRVLNEDRVQPGEGFGTHSHQDMEIVSYVLEGALAHKDSTGSRSVIQPGTVQRMSAGTGVSHSEFNASQTKRVHFLQIWFIPERSGLRPSYEERSYSDDELQGQLRLIASRDARDASLTVHQDLEIYAARLASADAVSYAPRPGRHVWLQVARGAISLNDNRLKAGDGVAIVEEGRIVIAASENAELLLFDMA